MSSTASASMSSAARVERQRHHFGLDAVALAQQDLRQRGAGARALVEGDAAHVPSRGRG